MKPAEDPCGPVGSVIVSEAWQSEQVIRFLVALLKPDATVRFNRFIAPRLPAAVVIIGWKEPAVSFASH